MSDIVSPSSDRKAAPSSAPGVEAETGLPPPPYPDPHVERMRGPKLALVWIGLAGAAWAVVGGVGYGLYRVATALLN